MFQSLAHAHDLLHDVAQTAVEFDSPIIGRPNLQIDLRAACRPQPPFRFFHDGSPQTKALMLWRNSHVIKPPAMAAIAVATIWPPNTPTKNKSGRTRSLRPISLRGSFQG